mmetsp:Transcript_14784/g.23022  ORF Transcript_14784/g.23022 Transcript_14784/m.23022 type:complete len:212 (-) Transcript_14784:392-1027(-)
MFSIPNEASHSEQDDGGQKQQKHSIYDTHDRDQHICYMPHMVHLMYVDAYQAFIRWRHRTKEVLPHVRDAPLGIRNICKMEGVRFQLFISGGEGQVAPAREIIAQFPKSVVYNVPSPRFGNVCLECLDIEVLVCLCDCDMVPDEEVLFRDMFTQHPALLLNRRVLPLVIKPGRNDKITEIKGNGNAGCTHIANRGDHMHLLLGHTLEQNEI